MAFDWVGLEKALVDGVVREVTRFVHDNPEEHFYGAGLFWSYYEQDGVITMPGLGVASVEWLAAEPVEVQDNVRWNPPDYEHYDDEWPGEDVRREWERALKAEACRSTTHHWHVTWRRFVATLVRVCRRSRADLRAAGITNRDFLVLVFDHYAYPEALIRRVLSSTEVRRHFPDLDELAVARAQLVAQPQAEQATFLVSRLRQYDGPIGSEEAEARLRDLGPVAFPALVSALETDGQTCAVAKLLADIGRPDDTVIAALTGALARTTGPDQAWVAAALSRLGHLTVVLDRANDLPQETVACAMCAPYTSFRDYAVAPPPLDYRPLADVLERLPDYRAVLTEELGIGHCTIRVDEVDEAVRGLASPHLVIRRHAVLVLGERRLGSRVGRRVLGLLGETARHDQEASIRRLAILSLMGWGKQSSPFVDVVRGALEDPAREVRSIAAYCLREHNAALAT